MRQCTTDKPNDLTNLFPCNSHHYFLPVIINGSKVHAVVDPGSNVTIVSRGAARALNLSCNGISTSNSFQSVTGTESGYEGISRNITMAFHPMFEFDVDLVKVSQNDNFLILLGNDILSDNACYEYKGLKRKASDAKLRFYNKQQDILIDCPCIVGHDNTKVTDNV